MTMELQRELSLEAIVYRRLVLQLGSFQRGSAQDRDASSWWSARQSRKPPDDRREAKGVGRTPVAASDWGPRVHFVPDHAQVTAALSKVSALQSQAAPQKRSLNAQRKNPAGCPAGPSPLVLMRTARQAIDSPMFGEHADRQLMQAALDPVSSNMAS